MPLPTPNPNQSKKDFLKSCMANPVMNKEYPDNDQRYAVCNSQWEKNKKEGDMTTVKHKTYSAEMFVPEYNSNKGIKVKSENGEIYTAIAVVGDQFWNKGRKSPYSGKPEFSMADALKRDYKTMDNTFHNLDHAQRIQDLVGTNINTEFDEENKRMIIHIKPDKNMPAYKTWRSFLNMCRETGKTPNVSIEAYVTVEDMKASDLPEGINYQQYDIQDDDLVEVEKGYNFRATATVIMGACSDSDGCGINLNSINYSTNNDRWEYNEDKEVKNMTKKNKQDEKPEEPEETDEDETEEDKTEKNDVQKESDLVLTLKKKLAICGENRETIETEIETLQSERATFEERILELENTIQEKTATVDDLNEKLSQPVTKKQTETTKDENWKVGALKTLMRRE